MFPDLNRSAYLDKLEGSFIQHSHYYTNDKLGIALVDCQFDITTFTPYLFDELKVDLPSNIANAVIKRQAEFLAGRYAAKLAIRFCGASDTYVGIGENRAPIWPDGILGSISHSDNRAICVAALHDSVLGIGVDIEEIMDTSTCAAIREQVHDNDELEIFRRSGFSDEIATSLIFSAKESFFKAAYPRVKRYFGFEFARAIRVDPKESIIILAIDYELVSHFHFDKSYSVQFKITDHSVISFLLNHKPSIMKLIV